MGLNSGQVLLDQLYPEATEAIARLGVLGHSHGHNHGLEALGPNVNAAWLAAGSIIVKEWLYRTSKCLSPYNRILRKTHTDSDRSPFSSHENCN